MPNIVYPNMVVGGDAVLATVVSDNLTAITAVVNASNLDSVNYGVSSVQSSNITTNAILSQHISASQVVSAKISNSQIVHAKMNFISSDAGVRVVQIGATASDLPVNGLQLARMSGTLNLISNSISVSAAHVFSDALDGNPAFTTTPTMAGDPSIQGASILAGQEGVSINTLNSLSALLTYDWSASRSADAVFTYNFAVIGPK